MTMELSENTIGIWYVQTSETSDWLMTVNEDNESYDMTYRWRYYEDDKNFDSDDRKTWYSGTIAKTTTSREKLLAGMRGTVELMLKFPEAGKSWELLVEDHDIKAFMKKFESLPFVHMEVMPIKEAEEKGLVPPVH